MSKTINGQDLMVFVQKDGKYTAVAFATNHTLDVSMEQIDASTKDNGNGYWSNSEPGMMSWSITTENLMSDDGSNGYDYNGLFSIMLKRETVDVCFGLKSSLNGEDVTNDGSFNAPTSGWTPDETNCYTGKAYITSLSVTATNGEKATYNATFTGAGALILKGAGIKKKS